MAVLSTFVFLDLFLGNKDKEIMAVGRAVHAVTLYKNHCVTVWAAGNELLCVRDCVYGQWRC